ncbi:MAG: glycosyltransferase family 4 protein [Candidatus Omnitrophota bacterium]|nr:MAG: glycosyltransferase family 4 protein [Candidatus Omnitrophota bacterium]
MNKDKDAIYSEQKKLVIFSHLSNLHGAVLSLLDTIENLNKDKFNIYVGIPRWGPIVKRLKDIGIVPFVTYFPPMRYLRIRKKLKTLRSRCNIKITKILYEFFKTVLAVFRKWCTSRTKRWLLKIQPDIIYINTIIGAEILRFLKINRGAFLHKKCRWVWHIREVLSDNSHILTYKDYFNEFVQTAVNCSDILIFNSEVSRDTFLKYVRPEIQGVIREKSHVVYQGFMIPRQKPVSKTDAFFADSINIAVVGSVTSSKKQDIVIKALLPLKNYHKKINLIIFGKKDPAYYRQLRQFVRAYNLTDNVIFRDYVADLRFCMHKYFSILITPSLMEPFGRVVAEAMLQGLPVVAVNSGGYKEIIQDGVTGFLVEPDRPEDIAAAVKKIIDNPQLAETLTDNAFASVSERFNISNYINAIEKLFSC